MMLLLFMVGVREAMGGGCCQEGTGGGPKEVSLVAALEEVRTTLWLTEAQLNTIKAILERHGIKEGVHVCPMTEKGAEAVQGGCCAAKKEVKRLEKSAQ
jgi:hypothetical protein